MTRNEIAQLVAEQGLLDDEILAVTEVEPDEWSVRYERFDLAVSYDEASETLTLSASIGRPPEERRLQICELLLSYNLLWRDTGGLRMALAGRGGEAVQMLSIHAAALTARGLAARIAAFSERALAWRILMAEPAPSDTDAAPSAFLDNHLRV